MNKEKRDALCMYIMIMSVMRFTDKPSRTISDARQKLWKDMRREFLKAVKGSSIKQPTAEFKAINEEVADAWDATRRELVPKDAELQSSLAELIQHLWNRLNRNPHQEMYLSERGIMRIINSYIDSPVQSDRTMQGVDEYLNNSRALVDRFYEKLEIKKTNGLATRLKTLQLDAVYK